MSEVRKWDTTITVIITIHQYHSPVIIFKPYFRLGGGVGGGQASRARFGRAPPETRVRFGRAGLDLVERHTFRNGIRLCRHTAPFHWDWASRHYCGLHWKLTKLTLGVKCPQICYCFGLDPSRCSFMILPHHFWRFRYPFASLHYTTLLYTTLHYTTLHYTTLHNTTTTTTQLHNYTPLHSTTLNSITLHYTTLHSTTLHYTTLHYLPLHFTTLYYTTLHYTTTITTQLHSTTLNYTTLHYTTLHYTTLHHTTLHYLPLHFTTLHYTPLHYNYNYNYNYNYTTTLHYTQVH